MPSIQSKLFMALMKFSNSSKKRTSTDWNTSIPDLRRETTRASGLMGKLPRSLVVEAVDIGSLYAEWILPSGTSKDKAILYFHGGGYVIGSSKGHRPIVAKFVKGSGVGALVFDYRLAPEHPFPAALDDALAAYRWLLARGISANKIAFMGDSAGGGLCLATLLALKDQGAPLPAAALALSPWTDLKNTGDSIRSNASLDQFTWRDSWNIFSKHYCADRDPADPWISPLYGDLRGLPPLRIYVGGHELLLDDSLRFAQKVKEAGGEVTLTVGGGLFHCYPACAPLFPEASQAMKEISAFIKGAVGP